MIACNGGHKTKWWMRALCVAGIHWHGRKDGGIWYNQTQCHVCGLDDPTLLAIVIHREDRTE